MIKLTTKKKRNMKSSSWRYVRFFTDDFCFILLVEILVVIIDTFHVKIFLLEKDTAIGGYLCKHSKVCL